jgi:hypothetical protein
MMRWFLVISFVLIGHEALAFDCAGPRFRGPAPQINLVHVFCGEIRNGKPDGYHTELVHPTPSVSGVRDVQPMRGGRGLYNGTVLFTNGMTKFSSFYPRGCSEAQIEASIRFAVSQPKVAKTRGWGFVAPSAPPQGGAPYCTGTDGKPFVIRYATLSRGDINTAFPDSAELAP